MRYDPAQLRAHIYAAIPQGHVVSEHTDKEHFYRIGGGPLYPSVTGKLQHLKDEGLVNFKMNRALEYIFAHFKEFTDANILEHIEMAEKMPADIFTDAGDVGTRIHDIREKIFADWIATGVRPASFAGFIPEHDPDVRVISAIAALEKFCTDKCYIPVVTELYVYSHALKTAGALDDLGLMREEVRAGDPACVHDILQEPVRNVDRCIKCDAKWKWLFVLLDLKTSNRFKDSYFFQVSMYYDMVRKLTGLKLDRSFILKLSKEDRSYKIEDLKRPAKLAQYAKHIVRTNEGLELIKVLRKDNQRKVMKI